MILDILTWPIITFGFFKGAFKTYKTLKANENQNEKDQERVSDKEKEKILEYWVVLIFVIYLFPWLEQIFGWFMIGGILTMAKLATLFAVVISEKGYGWMYKLVEEQFMPIIEPYINQLLEYSSGFRTTFCDLLVLGLHHCFQYIVYLCKSQMSVESLNLLGKNLLVTFQLIQNDEKQRKNQMKNESTPSIFEDVVQK